MKSKSINYQSDVILAGLVLILSDCNRSKPEQHEPTAQLFSIDTTYEDVAIPEVIDNTSDVYFERTVVALRNRKNKQAEAELTSGLTAFVEESQIGRVAPLSTLSGQAAKIKALIPLVKAGKVTPDMVAFTTGVGELLIAHDRIEKVESLPVFTAKMNAHLRQVLKNIERNTAHLGRKTEKDGVTVINDARRALNDFDNATVNDTKEAEQNVRNKFGKVKSFIKKYTQVE
ncbi:hypothetical protein [Spirosoma spitsbergense]|uniref:hypothetical protein n=1 Tax=Spirosoma spitsbergense TaxID=431554 RepID=UPI00036F53D5|nr:hypothetical protein [Spirosoma spitsbergense]